MLTKNFFNRKTKEVAKDLLGKYLIMKTQNGQESLMIKETEAYLGQKDKASHASAGRTKRTKVMFGPPGRWYVYLIYGMYDMLNIVTEKEGRGCAVLIRSAGNLDGPGKLTRELGVNKNFNGKPANKKTGLWIEDKNINISEDKVISSPRIGVEYAEEWAEKNLRFTIEGNE